MKSQSEQGATLYLIDGNSLLYRAYYAIPSLSNSKGEPTNAIYGFITMMKKLVEEAGPEYLVVCFDRKEPTFRHEQYEGYKAKRKPMPDDLAEQIEPIKQYCRLQGYAVSEKAGFEADDLMGTLARMGEEKGLQVVLVTGDKDAMQLVSDQVKILNPHKSNELIGPPEVKKRFDGLGPEQVVDLMALMGDSSDNIPGVPGIGPKTALKLIQEFETVEQLTENIKQIRSKSQQKLLSENLDSLKMSKDLAKIDTRVKLDLTWDEIEVGEPNTDHLSDFFTRYEFRSLLKEMSAAPEALLSCRYEAVDSEEKLKSFLSKLEKAKVFSFDTETTGPNPMSAELIGMSFCWDAQEAWYVPVSAKEHRGPGLDRKKVLPKLKAVLEDPSRKKMGQNFKYDLMIMRRNGIRLRGVIFDSMIASYLINPVKLNHNLDDISLEYLGVRKIPTEELIGKGRNQITMDEVPLETITQYAGEDAACVFKLEPVLRAKLKENKVESLFEDLEMPLAEVLAEMEMNGVCLDTDFLKELSDQTGRDLDKLSRAICDEAGSEFNINSTKQLAEVLFERMKLPVIKRTKTGYSTDVSVLEKLAEKYEFPKKILEYREKNKLKSTYLDALPEMMESATGKVHTSYHQTVTATGRLSSSEPNLQNIPIRTEGGRLIRKAFVPRPDGNKKNKILSADYSQIELRILAHLTDDPNLKKAFQEDLDVHKYTATVMYGVQENDVTREMRNVAKVINFSIIYGKTAYGLSKDLNISIAEAEQFIDEYFHRYHVVRDYLESQKELARKQGFLTTILGRRSYFPDINSKNMQVRQFAERAAINAPIQGSAADLIKLAMIAIQKKIKSKPYHSLMIMQVHDELVFDVVQEESDEFLELVRGEMENAQSLNVPLKVDLFAGDSWYKN